MKRIHVVAAVAAAVVLSGAGAALRLDRSNRGASGAPASSVDARPPSAPLLRLGLQPDTTYVYEFEFTSRTEAAPFAGSSMQPKDKQQTLSGVLDLKATLEIHAYSRDDRGLVLGYSVRDCKRASFAIQSQPVLGSADECERQLAGQSAIVEVDERGVVKSLRAERKATELARHLLQAIVAESQARLSPGPSGTWVEQEIVTHGVAQSIYHTDDGRTLTRARKAYSKLNAASMLSADLTSKVDGQHTIEFTPSGVLLGLGGREQLAASVDGKRMLTAEQRISLRLVDERAEVKSLPDLEGVVAHGLDQVPASEGSTRRSLEQDASGLTTAALLDTLKRFGEAQSLPDHNAFLVSASARLALDPAAARQVAKLYARSAPGGRGRARVLDLLSMCSAKHCQAALRDVLESPQSRSDPRRGVHLQRIGFVASPEPATVELAAREFRGGGKERVAAAFAVGAGARHLGDEAAAQRYHGELVEAVTQASAPDERSRYLRALANTQSAASVPVFASFAEDSSMVVRREVARGLDLPATPEARQVLLKLLRDAEPSVQDSALRSLRTHTLDRDELAALAATPVDRANVRAAIELARKYLTAYPAEARALLAALAPRAEGDGEAQAVIAALLGGAS